MPRSEGIETGTNGLTRKGDAIPERMPRSEGIETKGPAYIDNLSTMPGTNAPIRGD